MIYNSEEKKICILFVKDDGVLFVFFLNNFICNKTE